VIQLYNIVGLGARVDVTMDPLPKSVAETRTVEASPAAKPPAATPAPSPIVGALPPPHQG
jgi:hypothetical protein